MRFNRRGACLFMTESKILVQVVKALSGSVMLYMWLKDTCDKSHRNACSLKCLRFLYIRVVCCVVDGCVNVDEMVQKTG